MRVLIVRLLAIGIAIVVAAVVIQANLRPSEPRLLGHVLAKWPQGYWVLGTDYGWPSIYCSKGFDSDALDFYSTDVLIGNSLVGFVLAGLTPLSVELIIRCLRRPPRKYSGNETSTPIHGPQAGGLSY
jgi:hypothetical protein